MTLPTAQGALAGKVISRRCTYFTKSTAAYTEARVSALGLCYVANKGKIIRLFE